MRRAALPAALLCACALTLAAAGWRSAPPGLPLRSPAEYAWRLFAHVTGAAAPDGNPRWEHWPTGNRVYADPAVPLISPGDQRSSPPLFNSVETKAQPNFGACGQVLGNQAVSISLNWPAAHFIRDRGLEQRKKILAMHAGHQEIEFPRSAILAKFGWLEDPTTDTHQFVRYGRALGGLHIFSKAIPNWFFATFESTCVQSQSGSELVSPHQTDSFGYPDGKHASAALRRLFRKEGVADIWLNYRLVGTQTGYYAPDGTPIELGNRVLEAGLSHPSCMGCHARAGIAFNGNNQSGADNPTTGPPDSTLLADRILFDFVWSLDRAKPIPNPPDGH